ncbi:hypothetical protein SpCBS45565_g01328 [Spizellomyces sp. 'palustris']|nr:hypothetical protein SpCBS45565_g01328 [Spizellomyces sp. 'palustris']
MPTLHDIYHQLELPHLVDHGHIILASAIGCQFIYWIGYYLSAWSGNKHFAALSPIKRVDWALHIVSSVHAVAICFLAFPIFGEPTLQKDKVYGYAPYAGDVYAIATGYFLWDTIICLYYIAQFGVGFALHGLACLTVFGLCFRPFLMYFGAVFLMFELSTPFLNIHWFCDKTSRTGTKLQLVNGMILLIVFFVARICFGFYSSADFFVTVYHRRHEIPIVNIAVYSIANILLNALNVHWFSKMIRAIRSRFSPKDEKPKARQINGVRKSNGVHKSATLLDKDR